MSLASIPLVSGATGFLGHGPLLEKDRYDLFDRVTREIDHAGRLHFVTRDLVIVNSPRAVHDVLVTNAKSFEKSPLIRAALHALGGEGLFTAGGALWRRQRRLMAPMFHPVKIDALANTMVDCTVENCLQWHDGAMLDIAHETTRITMQIAGRTLFGIDTTSDAVALSDALTIALAGIDTASLSLSLALQVELRMALLERASGEGRFRKLLDEVAARLEPPIMWPTKSNRELKRAIAVLDERVQRMIDERRSSTEVKEDLLSHLLRARDDEDGTGMTDKQMRDEILTLFVAGHETTANGLAWTLYSLARDPVLYARARACVDSLKGRVPTINDLDSLGFLSCAFKEALRLFPPVYLFGRIAIEDTRIADFEIPKYTMVLVSPWTLQRRADLWPDPLRFDPDRFAPHNAATRPRDAWIPFSDGPRICIGQHFAQLEAPLVLAAMLQRADFELQSTAAIVPDKSPTLRPKGGVPVRIRLRS